ncbi:heterokaryon incompatibility protein (HET) domain-containing protein [Hirsutella rhossiliensis]|uniref:Heterokaryon incompatibility protein (HET) domain-containing protein n=1 Tax=Hirsutella rhossiliensis TaxID=111463 RepID=A0A9P8N3P0_9HYPO|nr:heterokaryon incompatibility protein (HET) domain-containing protein [Hirsutella rhossiliensis]KAH0966315.1 heterokaryon incompatibility protein (HET) domain-containing protein [Hirsutella rhossiliensis]
MVAREMGSSFIWIDSLCIMQDSKDDWKREAPRMSDIYRGAVLNIAATSGADTDAGCLPSRMQFSMEPLVITLQGTDFPDGHYTLYDHKAWVVQEILLAPRVLHMCATEMFWECPELRAFCGSYGHATNLARGGNPAAPTGLLWESWREVVEVYTKCGLTYPRDKLVAISGLAKLIQSIFNVDYSTVSTTFISSTDVVLDAYQG